MNQVTLLSNSFQETLKDADLQNITTELAETFTDCLFDEGVLREIPIIGTLVGVTKAALRLNERLLVKKLLYFLAEVKNIDPQKRKDLITKIENSETEQMKIGERLLYILDKCDDHITAKYVANLFSAFLNETISYNEFLRGSSIIQKLILQDLQKFIKTRVEDIESEITQYDKGMSDFQSSLIISGICATQHNTVSIRDQDDWKMSSQKYIVEGGDLIIYLTDIGYTLKKIFQES